MQDPETAFLMSQLKQVSSGSFAGRFLKHLGNIATVLLDSVCLSLFCFFMSFQTDWMMMMRSDLCMENGLCQTPRAKQKYMEAE